MGKDHFRTNNSSISLYIPQNKQSVGPWSYELSLPTFAKKCWVWDQSAAVPREPKAQGTRKVPNKQKNKTKQCSHHRHHIISIKISIQGIHSLDYG
jgi:hypothetical protein